MASGRIKGITIEIGGDTTKLQSSLKKVDKDLRTTQANLRDINKLLKLDPSNTELLTQKQKNLKDAVNQTKDRLQQLKDAQGQVAKGSDDWDALQREIIATEQDLKKAEDALKDFGSVGKQQLQVVADKVKDVGNKVTEFGKGLATHVTAPIVAVGAASMAAWTEVDEAMDTIITKTGASGDALEDMQKRAENLATSIPTDFMSAATAIGEVNTRFGLMGDALEDVSGKFIKFAEINGTDVNGSIDQIQATMAAWNIEASHAGTVLDLFNKVGQDTGADVLQLAANLQTNQVVFDQMGLSISDAANFLGNLDKNGIDAGVAMAGLKKALQNAAAEGVPMQTALASLEETLRSGKTDTEAYQAAMELFGNKAGPAIAQAVQQGNLSFTELQGTLEGFAGSVEETFEATLDPVDQLTTTMNELKLAGSDLGAAIQTAALPILQQLATTVSDLTAKFRSLSPEQQQTIVKIAALVAAIAPLLIIGGKIITGIGTVISTIGAIHGAITLLLPMIATVATAAAPFLVGGAIAAGIVAAGVLIYQNWDTIKLKATELWTSLTTTWENIKTTISTKVDETKTAVSTKWDEMKTNASTAGSEIKERFSDSFENIKNKASTTWENIKQTVSNGVEKLKSLVNFEWHLPHLALPHFSISGEFSLNPPSIPTIGVEWYKKAYNSGVLFKQPTVLQTPYGAKGFGDGSGAEVVLGLNRLRELVGNGRNIVNNINIYATENQDVNELADVIISRITATEERAMVGAI